MKALVKWQRDLNFKGQAESGHWVCMGPSRKGEETYGAAPMELLLISLAGCTAMDIVWILQKKRIVFEDFWVDIGAEKTDVHPKVYSSIHLKFVFVGKNLKREELEQAAALSAEKYCSVSAMVGKVANITHEVEIQEK
jgi:putative redox protein